MRVALIDKAPNNTDYKKYLEFDFDHYHLCSAALKKVLKKDVDIDIDLEAYDLIILVGAEAAKNYTKVSSITNIAGHLINDKFVCMSNPSALIFKPEGRADFLRSVDRIKNLINNNLKRPVDNVECIGITESSRAKEALLEIINNAKGVVAWDTETTALYPREGYILGVSLTYKPDQGFYILTDCLDDECIALLQQIATKFKPIFHNMKFDKKFIEFHLGIVFGENAYRIEDTMLLHYVLNENESHSLKDLTLKYGKLGDYDSELGLFKKQYCKNHKILEENFSYDLIPFEVMVPYACKDTVATFDLFHKFSPIVEANDKFRYVYRELLMEGSLFLLRMEEAGIPIDVDRMKYADAYLKDKIDEATELLYTFDEVKRFEDNTGSIFNAGSVVQLRTLLFDYIGLSPTGIKTKGGADSTSAEVLDQLTEETGHPVLKALLDIRRLSKLRNTYTTKILSKVNRDGKIRTGFNLTFTTSGRLSSSGNFNAQQIPRDDPIIKGCIRAPKGYKIVGQDLVTGEIYYAAILSGDKNLQDIFKKGGDFHSNIATEFFKAPCAPSEVKKLYPELRQFSKTISFAVLYGSGAAKVASEVAKNNSSYTVDDAREDISKYFAKFSKLKKWLDSRKKFILENGYTYSFFGRKRRLPNVQSKDKAVASHEVRSGINSEIQSVNITGRL